MPQISSYSINSAKEEDIIQNVADRLKKEITKKWFYIFYVTLEIFLFRFQKSLILTHHDSNLNFCKQ